MGNRDVFLRHDFCVCLIRRHSRGQKVARLSKFYKVTKGGSTGSTDTKEGVKKRIDGSPQPRPAHRWFDLIFLEPFV